MRLCDREKRCDKLSYAKTTRARAWMVTVQIANMVKAGLDEDEYMDPQRLGEFMMNTWNNSGKNRTCGIAVCRSADGLYHAHMACYGNTTTLSNIARTLYDSHVEPQQGGKSQLAAYLKKDPPYSVWNMLWIWRSLIAIPFHG